MGAIDVLALGLRLSNIAGIAATPEEWTDLVSELHNLSLEDNDDSLGSTSTLGTIVARLRSVTRRPNAAVRALAGTMPNNSDADVDRFFAPPTEYCGDVGRYADACRGPSRAKSATTLCRNAQQRARPRSACG